MITVISESNSWLKPLLSVNQHHRILPLSWICAICMKCISDKNVRDQSGAQEFTNLRHLLSSHHRLNSCVRAGIRTLAILHIYKKWHFYRVNPFFPTWLTHTPPLHQIQWIYVLMGIFYRHYILLGFAKGNDQSSKSYKETKQPCDKVVGTGMETSCQE